uniref:Uncharacterized protein n=1 Tax=Mycena chlorophos TaxID=658473 RepID=A0ABQ0LML5_MYCCL|nr:predicted protein [Mycena chlorophos]
MLWENTNTNTNGGRDPAGKGRLIEALELGQKILEAVERMEGLWPCEYIQHQTAALRDRLASAWVVSTTSPPPPMAASPSTSTHAHRPSPPVPMMMQGHTHGQWMAHEHGHGHGHGGVPMVSIARGARGM